MSLVLHYLLVLPPPLLRLHPPVPSHLGCQQVHSHLGAISVGPQKAQARRLPFSRTIRMSTDTLSLRPVKTRMRVRPRSSRRLLLSVLVLLLQLTVVLLHAPLVRHKQGASAPSRTTARDRCLQPRPRPVMLTTALLGLRPEAVGAGSLSRPSLLRVTLLPLLLLGAGHRKAREVAEQLLLLRSHLSHYGPPYNC